MDNDDIYVVFIEQGLKLLSANGQVDSILALPNSLGI